MQFTWKDRRVFLRSRVGCTPGRQSPISHLASQGHPGAGFRNERCGCLYGLKFCTTIVPLDNLVMTACPGTAQVVPCKGELRKLLMEWIQRQTGVCIDKIMSMQYVMISTTEHAANTSERIPCQVQLGGGLLARRYVFDAQMPFNLIYGQSLTKHAQQSK